ncbi:hypothetical protein ABK040_000167 [Willaertia magna]
MYSDNVLREEHIEESPPSFPPPVVLDIGSGVIKAGFAGEEVPSCCFNTVVGLPHCENEAEILARSKRLKSKLLSRLNKENDASNIESEKNENKYEEEYIIGQEALDERHSCQLFYPIEKGRIVDWEQIEFILEYVFLDDLKVELEETLLLITESITTTKKDREKMTEMMFELFQICGMSSMKQPLLSLYSAGKTTGLIIDSGDTITHTVPIYEGYVIDYAVNRLEIGGRDITNNLQRLLFRKGYQFTTSAEHHFIREIKESLAYVSIDYAKDCNKDMFSLEKNYELPDGQLITLDKELIDCTEILFDPMMLGKDCSGVAQMCFNTFNSCPLDVKKDFYSSIILSGGNTLFPGFRERIKKELESSDKTFRSFNVKADPIRQFSSWMGGSVIASLPTFEETVITFEHYDDYGINCLYRKDE